VAERTFLATVARAGACAALAALTLVSVSACTTDDQPAAAEYTPPAWFAEQARAREEMASKLQTCMDAKGWTVTLNEYGGAAEAFTTEEELDRFNEDSMQCQIESGRNVAAVTEAELRADYRRDVDTMRCLRNEGFDVADPPSEDAYVESRLATVPPDDLWVPYDDPALQDVLGTGDAAALERTCPQNWS
jgi:hypothetical protein